MLIGNALVVHDGNEHLWKDPSVNGSRVTRGLVPRNYDTHPLGYYPTIKPYHAVNMPLVPQSDWATRLKDLRDGGALLSQVRRRGNHGQPIPSRDQNGKGYCWAHSGTSAHIIVRARDGQPYADLSAYAIACQIKNFRDEGGWGAQGVDWQSQHGVPTSRTWAQQSMSRSNVNDAMRADSMLHLIDTGWIDLQAAQYDRNLSWQQYVTSWLTGCPTVNDYNWWSHSVCGVEPVDGASAFSESRDLASGKRTALRAFERVWDMGDPVTAGWGCKIWNSWGDSWSDMGEGVLPPSKAVPDGGVALCTVTASAV
jgi:hypothetical protein